MPIFTVGAAGKTSSESYDVSYSTMFETNALSSRTPSSAGNRRTYTISQWAKKSSLATSNNVIFCAGESTNDQLNIFFRDTIIVQDETSNVANFTLATNAVFRDTSAWYHVVLAVDTTQSTASDRVKLYVNGQQITSFSTEDYPTQNVETNVNRTINHSIAGRGYQSAQYFDGYLSECVLIDGQALSPTSFGEVDAASGIWKPKDVSNLTFGTNGHYYDFATKATDPVDASGNGHTMSSSNVLSTDWSLDTPTNNFCTLNIQYWNPTRSNVTNYSIGMTKGDGIADAMAEGTMSVHSGKWYYEARQTGDTMYGWGKASLWGGDAPGQSSIEASAGVGVHAAGRILINGSYITSVSRAFNSGTNTVMVAIDFDNQKFYYGTNGTWANSYDPSAGTGGDSLNSTFWDGFNYVPAFRISNSGTDFSEVNFGNPLRSISSGNSDANGYGNFEYTVPTGFYALCSKNLAEFG